ncbi:metallophosphoesterase [Bacillus sp. HMF5848]|uniref:metallophosphoesterase family protein n=1 Tax=Bacillus sp. HMF5848 TaxID=2495421 RepID=UPI000F7B0DCB|nr:metallophosphoesterase [Bacillus sp. HMF5848]RSK28064.1 metallophosphoesterase [Bacillus sp. HMF5848]
MKLLITSDSHGWQKQLLDIKKNHEDVTDLIHCGDSELAADTDELVGYQVVRGNCDYDSGFPNDLITEFAGYKIYVTHGHLYNVKMSLQNLLYRAQETGAKIVCFGHSHIAGSEMIDNVLFINPGSIRLPRKRQEETYAILEVVANSVTVRFYQLNGVEVASLRATYTL